MTKNCSQHRGLMRLQAGAKRMFHSEAACWTDTALCPARMQKDCSQQSLHTSRKKRLTSRQPAGLRLLQLDGKGLRLAQTLTRQPQRISHQHPSRLQACVLAFSSAQHMHAAAWRTHCFWLVCGPQQSSPEAMRRPPLIVLWIR